jgi:FkbM family methyltransferase
MHEVKNVGHFKMYCREGSNDWGIIEPELNNTEYQVPSVLNKVIDIGAHIGGTAVFCGHFGAEVWAYEPQSDNYEMLKANVALNGIEDRVHCIQKAVGLQETLKIAVNRGNMGNIGTYREGSEVEEVESISLNDIMKEVGEIDLLKLDCEGGEYDILFTLNPKYFHKIKQISVELHYAKDAANPPELVRKYGEFFSRDAALLLKKYYKVETFVSPSGSAFILICKRHGL